MKTHPIIFSTPMVQAILEGRKTMTRRICKHEGPILIAQNPTLLKAGKLSFNWSIYGEVGDVLWVRESFYCSKRPYVYKADNNSVLGAIPLKWKPSIHMPKSACRIWLEVTSIRVERLLSISFEDAKKEGILGLNCCERYFDYVSKDYTKPNALASFSSLWVSIHGTESWNSNPFVWVIEFKRIDKPENF